MANALHLDPTALEATLPRELRDRDQWVVWRYEVRGGKRTKVPYDPRTGKKARAGDPQTWTSYTVALLAFASGRYAGIGFEFSAEDPYCGIDLDHSIVDGVVQPWAREILALLPTNSYTELSPSGLGLHVIVRARKAGDRSRISIGDGAVEIYDRARFFTVSGALLAPTTTTVAEAQEGLDALYRKLFDPARRLNGCPQPAVGPAHASDQQALDRAFASRNGTEIRALWNGDTSGYPSHSEADLALCSHLWFWTDGDAAQVDALFRRSGLMRAKWGRTDYREATIARAADGSSTRGRRNSSGDSNGTSRHAHRSEVPTAAPQSTIELDPLDAPQSYDTHRANAWRLAKRHGGELRFAPGLGFLIYDGRRWKSSQHEALRLASRVSKYICEEAAAIMRQAAETEDEEQRKALEKRAEKLSAWARTSEQGNAIRESLKLTAPLVATEPSEFDRHPLLLNVENGTVDLEEGTILPHSPGDFLTKVAPVWYYPEAEAPLWREFIDRIMGGRQSLARYLQKAMGYSLTGLVREQCLFFSYGHGQNGKTTFLEAVRETLGGDYVIKAAPDLLMLSNLGRPHPSEVVDLRGARLVICQEVAPGKTFDAQKLKELTGERWLKARQMYGQWFEFEATSKLWLAANHRPRTKDNSLAFWRRVHLVPFTETITSPDRRFSAKLAAEKSGILNWLLEGTRLYLEEGLEAPPEVTAAVEEYRSESDTLRQFIAECCVTGTTCEVRATELWTAYEAYARERDLPTIRRRDLKTELLNRGLRQPPRRSDGFYYLGLCLRR